MFMLDNLSETINCGGTGIEMARMIPYLISLVITAIKIVVPVLLVVFGMLDLGKAVMAQKEDEIKKGQQTFVKRLVAAVITFLIVFVVQLVIGLVAPKDGNDSMWSCVDCLINYSGGSNTNCQ